MEPTQHRYAARVVWTGSNGTGTTGYTDYGRTYTMEVEGKPTLSGSAAPEFRGDPARHNPEDLFIAAIAGCHMLTYLALCARHGVQVLAYEDASSGSLAIDAPGGGGGRFTRIDLEPTVIIAETADEAVAERLHQTAHERCFIANSCAVPIRCHATVRVAKESGSREVESAR
jgi:organic hydroperoxide reductase OsmC/OhrA